MISQSLLGNLVAGNITEKTGLSFPGQPRFFSGGSVSDYAGSSHATATEDLLVRWNKSCNGFLSVVTLHVGGLGQPLQ
jgi:hypothetical protein